MFEVNLNLTNTTITGSKSSVDPHPTQTHEFLLQLDQFKLKQKALDTCSQTPSCSNYMRPDDTIQRFYLNLAQCDSSLNQAGKNTLINAMSDVFRSRPEVFVDMKYEFYRNYDVDKVANSNPEVCAKYPEFFRTRRLVEVGRVGVNRMGYEQFLKYEEAV